ncbi:MAG: peptidylprolyl isomerase [Ignavibacteriaceae bacterium]|nr:peptidylprolyl isomerase [Ignavibacteriaceae bacterium]
MKHLVFVLCLCCFIGCSSTQQTTDNSFPQLLTRTPLPIIPAAVSQPYFEMDMVLFILEDGSVNNIRLRKASGDAAWDSLAAASIRQWRFVPAHLENHPVSAWFRLRLMVRYANPQYLSLAEIMCPTKEKADSVYDALEKGEDFGELATLYSVAPSRERKGELGEVDINLYSENVCEVIKHLGVEEFTKPIKYGDLFAIFKRLKK